MKEKKVNKVMMVLLIVILLSSMFSLFSFGEQGKETTLNIPTKIVILDSLAYSNNVEVNNGSYLYHLIQNFEGSSFESDGDLKSLVGYQNNFMTNNYWQMFVNSREVSYEYLLNENDFVLLYYGTPTSFFNITIFLKLDNMIQNNNITIQEGLTLNDLISNYNSSFNNSEIICLFDYCNDENSSWRYLINGAPSNLTHLLEENDLLSLIFD